MTEKELQKMEQEIIERYTDKLKEILFNDDRIPKAETLYVSMDVDKAKHEYNKLHLRKLNI